jgi:hypothetical protein
MMKPRRILALVTFPLLLMVIVVTTGVISNAQAAPASTPSSNNIVISEIKTRGVFGIYDEFVELFNPSAQEIDISGWLVSVSAGCGTSTIDLISITPSTILAPGQHYLLASSASPVDNADQTWSSSSTLSIPDQGGVALFDLSRVQPVDSVGMCADTLYVEGVFLPPIMTDFNDSYERLPGGDSGNCTDTDDNQDDFLRLRPSTPQDSSSPLTTTCIPSIPTQTFTNTSTPLPPGSIVISEFRTRGTNGEGDEFLEIFNPTTASVFIGGWQVWRSSGCGVVTTALFNFPDDAWLLPGHHYLAASIDSSLSIPPDQVYTGQLSDTGGVALLNRSGLIIDQVGMCVDTQYREGLPLAPLTEDIDQSYERKPGGSGGACYDTSDNGSDFGLISTALPENLDSLPVYCAGVKTSTPKFTPTFPGNSDHIVISEFRTRGPLGDSDEFIELYNPTGGSVNIGGWTLKRSAGCGSTITSMLTITSGLILQAGQHYLLLSYPGSSLVGADQTFSAGIADNGGIALLNSSNVIVDQVGMCADTAYHEDLTLEALSGLLNQSYERLNGGSTSCQDTNNNLDDFQWIGGSFPQNRLSPVVLCSGVKTYTPTVSPTKTRTLTRTPSATATFYPGNVVLNEYLPHPSSDWDGSGEADTRDEYIEVINMGTREINLKNWKLDDIADDGSSPFTIPNMVLAPREIARFFASETGISLSDGGDTVRLIKPDGRTADIHTYTIVTISNRAWCRIPDGTGVWGFLCRPTPGRPNILAPGDDSRPDDSESGTEIDCELPGSIPMPFWMAECTSLGGAVSLIQVDFAVWLSGDYKWGVFIK